jgi:hypothetical protein
MYRPAGIFSTIAVAVALSVSGCAAPAVQVERLSSQIFAPTAYVQVLQEAPKQPYETIARLHLSGESNQTAAQVIAELEKQASALGANAVILSNESKVSTPQLSLDPSGGTYRVQTEQIIPSYSALAIRILEKK